MERQEARAALGSIGDAHARLAAAAECPPWRHAVFGLIMALLVLGLGIGGTTQFALMAVAMALTAIVVMHDRKRMGVFANGYRRGSTLPVALGLVVVTMLLIAAQIRLREADGSMTVAWLITGAEFVVATVSSVLWQWRFRAELMKGQA